MSVCPSVTLVHGLQWRCHGVDWGGHVYPTFARGRSWNWYKSDEFYRVRGRRGGGRLRLQTPVIGSRSALAMSVDHPTYFDLATPMVLDCVQIRRGINVGSLHVIAPCFSCPTHWSRLTAVNPLSPKCFPKVTHPCVFAPNYTETWIPAKRMNGSRWNLAGRLSSAIVRLR